MKQNTDFFLRKIGDTYLLQYSDLYEKKMVLLNETGAFLWEKLRDCGTKEELVNELITFYDVQKNIAEKDVECFLTFLSENGCLIQGE